MEWAADPQRAIAEVCEWVETRGSDGHLLAFTRAHDFPYSTVRDWIGADAARAAAYATARERRADVMAEELIAIADADPGRTSQGGIDAGAVAHLRLRVDTRKWIAAKLAPTRYGERVELQATLTTDRLGELRDRIHAEGSLIPINRKEP